MQRSITAQTTTREQRGRRRKHRPGCFLSFFHENQSGQTMVFIAIILLTLAFFFVLVVDTGHEVSKRLFIQNTGDSVALSAATWQARIMNVIALINIAMAIILGIIIVLEAIGTALEIAYYVVTGLLIAATVCCAIPYTAAACCPTIAGLEAVQQVVQELHEAYDEVVDPIIDVLWEIEDILSELEPPIIQASPAITIAMAEWVAYENARLEDPSVTFGVDIIVIPWPIWPELPLEEGTIEDVCDYVRKYVDEEIVSELPPVIDYIVDAIIDAAISVTCEGGTGDYSFETDAGGCNECSQKISDGTVTSTKWYVTVDEYAGWDICENGSQLSHQEWENYSHQHVPPSGFSWSDMSTETDDVTLEDGTTATGETCCFLKKEPREKVFGWQLDDEDDDGEFLDPSEKYCKVEKWCLQECKYEYTGTAESSSSGNEDKVRPWILEDDWRENNSFFALTRYKTGESLLLGQHFETDIRSSIGSISFAQASFFFLGDDEPDMFHLNWYSKLVPIETDSDVLSQITSILPGVTDQIITH